MRKSCAFSLPVSNAARGRGASKSQKGCQRQISIIPKSTNESYSLEIALLGDDNGDQIDVTITSDDYFGARHALETLTQLIAYDENTGSVVQASRRHGPIVTASRQTS